MAWAVLLESLVFWGYLIVVRARAARAMEISGWYAITTPLGAAVFAAMMITSAFRVISGKGVSWKGRLYVTKIVGIYFGKSSKPTSVGESSL